MRLWSEWVKNKQLKEEEGLSPDPDQTFKFNRDNSEMGVDHDAIKRELFESVWNRYTDETMQFLSGIAQRGDQEVAALLRKLEQDVAPSQSKEPKHPTDYDEIVPPEADSGNSGEGGEE